MDQPALFRAYPRLARSIPWLPLGQWPTPVAHLEHLSKKCGAELWIKQDDLSGPIFGGNKVRKLEHLLAAARQDGARSVVTVGGIGSSHVAATALYAKQVGMSTAAVVFPQPINPMVHTTMGICEALGVQLHPCASRLLVPLYLERARFQERKPYLIGPGGSSPLGTLGFVSAGLELGEQIKAGLLPQPDDIFITLGTGGSMAGLFLGLGLAGIHSRILGVRVVERALSNLTLLKILIHRTKKLLQIHGLNAPRPDGLNAARPHNQLLVLHDYFGGRYGRPTAAAEGALALVHELEGLQLETTYTAKTMASLLDYCRGEGRGRRILFWNTHNSRDLSNILNSPPSKLPPVIDKWIRKQYREISETHQTSGK